MLNPILDLEPSALVAPQSLRDGMRTAVNALGSTIQDNIAVISKVVCGDRDNSLITDVGASDEI